MGVHQWSGELVVGEVDVVEEDEIDPLEGFTREARGNCPPVLDVI